MTGDPAWRLPCALGLACFQDVPGFSQSEARGFRAMKLRLAQAFCFTGTAGGYLLFGAKLLTFRNALETLLCPKLAYAPERDLADDRRAPFAGCAAHANREAYGLCKPVAEACG